MLSRLVSNSWPPALVSQSSGIIGVCPTPCPLEVTIPPHPQISPATCPGNPPSHMPCPLLPPSAPTHTLLSTPGFPQPSCRASLAAPPALTQPLLNQPLSTFQPRPSKPAFPNPVVQFCPYQVVPRLLSGTARPSPGPTRFPGSSPTYLAAPRPLSTWSPHLVPSEPLPSFRPLHLAACARLSGSALTWSLPAPRHPPNPLLTWLPPVPSAGLKR